MPTAQLAFYVDTTRCINCRTCEVACKEINNALLGVRIRRVRSFEGGEFPKVFAYNISMSCNHCENPLCLMGCPSRAYTKRQADGIVLHDPERCIGCRYCIWVCPYGAPQWDRAAGIVRKCNWCIDLVGPGEDPVCVSSCPTRAIEIGSLAHIEQRPGSTIAVRNLPSPALTGPSARYRVRPEARSG